ncbi:hypothetical protein ES707_22524 [subsurface metagenome]
MDCTKETSILRIGAEMYQIVRTVKEGGEIDGKGKSSKEKNCQEEDC